MIDEKKRNESPIEHHIQRSIIGVLSTTRSARFRDMRPDKVDTNLYSYHLKSLIDRGFIQRSAGGYCLSPQGLAYVDTLSLASLIPRHQPKIIIMAVIQDGYGNVLLQKRTKQPYIDTWTLVYGKLHMEDKSLMHAMHREVKEKTGMLGLGLSHAGDAYLRVKSKGDLVSVTLAHIFYAEVDEQVAKEGFMWCDPAKLGRLDLAPCVEQIVARTFFRDPHFFEEFSTEWKLG